MYKIKIYSILFVVLIGFTTLFTKPVFQQEEWVNDPEKAMPYNALFSVDGNTYRVIENHGDEYSVAFIGTTCEEKILDIPGTITYNDVKYDVEQIDNCCNENEFEQIIIGKNVEKICKDAFKNSKNLKYVLIKSRDIYEIQDGVFGMVENVTFEMPDFKSERYVLWLKLDGRDYTLITWDAAGNNIDR